MIVTTEKSSEARITGFGARLTAAREALKMSDKDAAARLHLNPRIINIIESGNFEDGPPMIFMRGYLRSYAKLLNIPADEITAALAKIEPTTPNVTATTTNRNRAPQHTSRMLTRWTTYLVILILTTLVALWWRSTHSNASLLAKNTAETPSETISQTIAAAPIVALNNSVQSVHTPTPQQAAPIPASTNAAGEITIARSDPDAPAANIIQPVIPSTEAAAAPQASNATPTSPQTAETAPQATAPATQTPQAPIAQAAPTAPEVAQPAAQPATAPDANTAPNAVPPAANATPPASLPPANTSVTAKAAQNPNVTAPLETSEADTQPDLTEAKMDLPEPGLEETNDSVYN